MLCVIACNLKVFTELEICLWVNQRNIDNEIPREQCSLVYHKTCVLFFQGTCPLCTCQSQQFYNGLQHPAECCQASNLYSVSTANTTCIRQKQEELNEMTQSYTLTMSFPSSDCHSLLEQISNFLADGSDKTYTGSVDSINNCIRQHLKTMWFDNKIKQLIAMQQQNLTNYCGNGTNWMSLSLS